MWNSLDPQRPRLNGPARERSNRPLASPSPRDLDDDAYPFSESNDRQTASPKSPAKPARPRPAPLPSPAASGRASASGGSRFRSLGALVVGVAVAVWLWGGSRDHAGSENASAPGSTAVAGESTALLSPEDMDLEISRSARELAAVGDVETLASALQAAHPNPIVQIEMPGQQLAELLRDDRVAFYRIDLIDIIDEDGDVVRVYVNDAPYATVPLLNAGTTVIVPIAPGGATRVSLAGIADGAGGITLGCRTSQGTVTCQPLRVGDYVPLDIVLP